MRIRFIQTVFVVFQLVFPVLGASQPDANRVSYQFTTGENGVQVKVYGIEGRRRDQPQHRLCYADFDVALPASAALPQLAQSLNASPQVFATLFQSGRVAFPAPALADAKLENGKLNLIPNVADVPAVPIEACTRTDLLNFGPQVHAAPPTPGWTCAAVTGPDETLTFTLRQSALNHLQANTRLDAGGQPRILANWDSVQVATEGGEWTFTGNIGDTRFELSGTPAAQGFDARLDLETPTRQLHGQSMHCQLDPQS